MRSGTNHVVVIRNSAFQLYVLVIRLSRVERGLDTATAVKRQSLSGMRTAQESSVREGGLLWDRHGFTLARCKSKNECWRVVFARRLQGAGAVRDVDVEPARSEPADYKLGKDSESND